MTNQKLPEYEYITFSNLLIRNNDFNGTLALIKGSVFLYCRLRLVLSVGLLNLNIHTYTSKRTMSSISK